MKTLIKIRDMLSAIAGEPGIGLAELSRRLSMPKTTTYRILRALRTSGFVTEMEDQHSFRLGPLIDDLASGNSGRERLVRVARPLMVRLRDRCDETVALHVLEAGSWIVADQVESTQELRRTITSLGTPMPLGVAAAGKLLLAYMPEKQREAYLRQNKLRVHTPRTLNVQSLKKDLVLIARRGYATSYEELVPGVAGISMPIVSKDGAVRAAVGVSGPVGRFGPKAVVGIREALGKAVNEIKVQLDRKAERVRE